MTTIVTHDGHFHTDDLLACAVLLLKYPSATIVRSRDHSVIDKADIAVDVGGVYDPSRLRFDHHQPEGAGKRDNGLPYASLGLVWKEYGRELSGGEDVARLIEEKLVSSVDALDNGINLSRPFFENVKQYSVGDYFESFSTDAETMEDFDRIFSEVLMLAAGLIEREIRDARRTAADWKEVREMYEKAADKHIVILPRHMRWKRLLISTEASFVVYPRPDGKWSSQAVPKAINTFELKRGFPSAWSGLRDGDFASVSGVPDAFFCHRDCFLVVAGSKEGAYKLAEIALNS